MPKLTGATFTENPVDDYSEVPGDTFRRLTTAKLWDKASKHFLKAYDKRVRGKLAYPELMRADGSPEEKKAAKWRWIRTHWVPDEIWSADLAGRDGAETPLTTPEVTGQDGVDEQEEPPEDENELALPDEEKRKRPRDANPVDNSIPIPAYEDRAVTLDEMYRAACWALHNALHVKARRRTLRDAPPDVASLCWAYVNWALDDFKGFNLFVYDKLEKTLAKQAEIKQRRYDDDREVSRVLERLAEAESRAGVRLLPSRAEDAAGEPCLSASAD
jgi:hypothetical protein